MKKTPKKEHRLRSAKDWIQSYSGNNIVKGYSKYFAVDKLCAVKELKMLGFHISEEYELQLNNSISALNRQKLSFKKKQDAELNALYDFEKDENFAMIMGYTSGGCPYGITHDEMKNLEMKIENAGDLIKKINNQSF